MSDHHVVQDFVDFFPWMWLDLCARFERSRTAFVSRLRAASADDLARASKHPRLGTPMRFNRAGVLRR
jgi:hypothetical protein